MNRIIIIVCTLLMVVFYQAGLKKICPTVDRPDLVPVIIPVVKEPVVTKVTFNYLMEETMAINKHQLRDLIRIVLQYLEPEIPYSEDAVELLMMTAAVESNLGDYVKQTKGPAKGIFQVEPITEKDVMERYLGAEHRSRLLAKVNKLAGDPPPGVDPAMFDLDYQIALARCFYWMKPGALPKVTMLEDGNYYHRPDYDSILRMARYYKKYYNTYLGKSTIKKTIDKYCKYAV